MKKEENIEEFPEEILINSEYKYFTEKDSMDENLKQSNKEAIILCLQGDFDGGIAKFKKLSGENPEFRFFYYNLAIAERDSSFIHALASMGFVHNPSSKDSNFAQDFVKLRKFFNSLIIKPSIEI